jgi:outer membrane protein assembly factor BamB
MRTVLLTVLLGLLAAPAAAEGNWPQFRGPAGDGHAEANELPLTWSPTQNVKWKTAIHDRGWSSPVIWGRQVWLTTGTKDGRQLFAVCVDRDTGKVVHDVKVFQVPRPQNVASINSYASPTPAIEAGRVYVHFGTHGTACLDTQTGRTLWARGDLNCDHHMGAGASPILFENLLILTVDGCDVQYVAALDKASGKTVWKTDRSVDYSRINRYHRKAFCTPTVIEHQGRPVLISPGSKAAMAYDPRTGKELWKVRYGGWSVTPRPLFGHGLVFLTIDYDFPELWAVRAGGQGDVTDTHVAWKIERGKGMPATPSQLLVGEWLFMVNDKGTAFCVEAKTGQIVWRQRIGGKFAASPLYADGRIYFFSDDCVTTVIEPGRQYKPLAVNRLDERMMASPAAVGKALFLRTQSHLYRIEE